MGERLVADQRRPLGAQRRRLDRHRLVVVLVAVVAAAHVGLEDLLPQLPVVGVLQERPDAGRVQREHPLARQPRSLRRLRRAGDDRVGQPRQVGLLLDDEPVRVRVAKEVVAERHAERREARVDLAQGSLLLRVEAGAAAHEDPVHVLEEFAFGRRECQPITLLPHLRDPREQGGVHPDVVLRRRQHRRDLAADRLELVVGFSRGEILEDTVHL